MFRKLKIQQPKPFERVPAKFILSGDVPESWLDNGFKVCSSVLLTVYNNKGFPFVNSSVPIHFSWFSKFRKRYRFSTVIEFDQINFNFIKPTQGRILIELRGQKIEQRFFLPIIIEGFDLDQTSKSEIDERHKLLSSIIIQYEKDIENYNKEIGEIRTKRQIKDDLFNNIELEGHSIVNVEISDKLFNSLERIKNNFYFEEDDAENKLNQKYKEALEWRGPFLGGQAGRQNGFEFQVYSNDHGRHFHVIHKGKGINARFSFPEIELLNYKNDRNKLTSRESRWVKDFFDIPDNFAALKAEFDKR